MPVNTHRKKGKYLFFQLSVTNQLFINNMAAFFIGCTCPAPEPCLEPARGAAPPRQRRFNHQDQYERHIRDRHPDLYFEPRNILLPPYNDPGTPHGFQGTSYKWVITKLHEVNNEGVEKWVILKIPRNLVDTADVDQLNISGLSLNGIFMSFILQ